MSRSSMQKRDRLLVREVVPEETTSRGARELVGRRFIPVYGLIQAAWDWADA
jgi:hypothetical protein